MIGTAKGVLQSISATIAILGLALIGGCAANGEMTTGKITSAEKAIAVAMEVNAQAEAPAELKIARDKLTEARVAQVEDQHKEAQRLADEASVEADFARTKATTAKTKRMVADAQENIRVLRREIETSPER